MKSALYILFLYIFVSFHFNLHAQIEKVIVETYYISDTIDATDTTGGKLEAGTTTYRVYIDLTKGSKLTKIYGDENHPLKFSSTAVFFNNTADGQTFAKDFSKNRLGENTVALDTWLTLGQVTKKALKTYFGILKPQDTDGSIIGGANNDGGSAGIPGGLLVNIDPVAGIPITTADGLDTMMTIPSNWLDNGFRNSISGEDSTIFGSLKSGSQFISNNAFLQNEGVMGLNPDSNQILVAQLTTKGTLSFELNVEVNDEKGNIIKYVAQGHDTLDEKYSSFLTYPPKCGCLNPGYLEYDPRLTCSDSNLCKTHVPCGCLNPKYLEYNSGFTCSDSNSCKTPIVLGCMDPYACNFDPKANFSVQTLCCYPGYCLDRDISLVCPNLGIEEIKGIYGFKLYPNPAVDQLEIQFSSNNNQTLKFSIYDSFGREVLQNYIYTMNGYQVQKVNISDLVSGLYLFKISIAGINSTKVFIKK